LEIERAVAATGKTPLEVMLEEMRFYYEAGNLDKAVAFAKDAAPYPRMASVEIGGKPGAPPIETKDVSSVELARRIAFIFGQAAREQAEASIGGD
jgi:hypothetical protein